MPVQPSNHRQDPGVPTSAEGTPDIDVVIVLYRSRHSIAACVSSLLRSTRRPLRVWLVDNDGGPESGLEEALAVHPEARRLSPGGNLGFGHGCNAAIRLGHAPLVLLLNPDVELEPGSIDALADRLVEDPRLAAVGPLLLRSSGRGIDSAGLEEMSCGWFRDRCRDRGEDGAPPSGDVDGLCGAVLLMRRAALASIGRSEECFWGDLFLYNEDVELCMALRGAGWRLAYVRESRAFHAVGGSGAARSWTSALAARNRVLTLLVHLRLDRRPSPHRMLRWARRLALDARKFFALGQVPVPQPGIIELLGQAWRRRGHAIALRGKATPPLPQSGRRPIH